MSILQSSSPSFNVHQSELTVAHFGQWVLAPRGVPSGSVLKIPPADAGDAASILGLGKPPGGGNGNPLQCSGLENPMDRGAWWATVHRVTKSQT